MSSALQQPNQPSIFRRIVDREIPATIRYESETVIAFDDIAPKAPVHLLVVPKTEQYADVVALAAGDPGLLAELVSVAATLAADESLMKGYPTSQFRLIFNTGAAAGQTVFHVHAHVMAGDLEEGSLV